MPSILDYDELNLTGLEIEPVELRVERLRASFGGGYGANAAVGAASGLWGWELSSEVVTDDSSYSDTIAGVPSAEYYFQFFLDHTVGDSDPVFMIDFRGRKFHCSFADDSISGSMLTYDLFSLSGVRLEMRRVPGIYYRSDGSVFDPREIDNLWHWSRADDVVELDDENPDISGLGNDLVWFDDVTKVAAQQNARPIVRLSALFEVPEPRGYLKREEGVRVHAALIVMKMREATFSNDAGILTGFGAASTKILAATTGTTKFASQAFGGTFQYALNGTNYAEANQQAPMNAFGIVSVTSSGGITLDGLQFGKSRDTAGTGALVDIGEIIIVGTDIVDAPMSGPEFTTFTSTDLPDLIGFLRLGWDTPAS